MARATLRSRLLLLAAALLAALGLGELAARALLPPPQTVQFRGPSSDGMPAAVPEGQRHVASTKSRITGVALQYTTDTGRRMVPNVDLVIEDHFLSGRRVELSTNALGYRNRDLGPKTAPRLLFLGDSITISDYLAEEQTFVRLVEDAGDGAWETVNAAVGALGLESEIAMLHETGLLTDPDAVVLCFYLNDFRDSDGARLSRLPGWLRHSRLLYHGARALLHRRAGVSLEDEPDLQAWADEFAAAHETADGDPTTSRAAFHGHALRHFVDWGGAWSPHAWTDMAPLFDALADVGRQHDLPVVVAAFPVRFQVEAGFLEDWPQQQLRSVADEHGFPLLDLLPALREAHRKGVPLYHDQCHLTVEGQVVVADALAPFLAEALDVNVGIDGNR